MTLRDLAEGLQVAWKSDRWRRALSIAVVSDVLGFGVALVPPAEWVLDGVTAVALFAALGFRRPLLLALAIEAVPALQLFPAWTLVVAALAVAESRTVPGPRKD